MAQNHLKIELRVEKSKQMQSILKQILMEGYTKYNNTVDLEPHEDLSFVGNTLASTFVVLV